VRQLSLERVEPRIASRGAKTMAVEVTGDVDEVRIVERRRRALEGLGGELPGRRPGLPEEAAQRTPIAGERRASAFNVEIEEMPDRAFPFGRSGLCGANAS